ncbi:hypothetical protein ACVMIX_003254 [Rhizobium leguminosarum]
MLRLAVNPRGRGVPIGRDGDGERTGFSDFSVRVETPGEHLHPFAATSSRRTGFARIEPPARATHRSLFLERGSGHETPTFPTEFCGENPRTLSGKTGVSQKSGFVGRYDASLLPKHRLDTSRKREPNIVRPAPHHWPRTGTKEIFSRHFGKSSFNTLIDNSHSRRDLLRISSTHDLQFVRCHQQINSDE